MPENYIDVISVNNTQYDIHDTGAREDVDDLKSAINEPTTGLNGKAPVITDTASGSIASFPDGADGVPAKSLTVGIEPVQSGSGDPSPTNVRPISGWTGANVTRTGENLLDITNSFAVNTGILKGTEINLSAGTTIYFQRSGGTTSNLYCRGKDGSMFEIHTILETKTSISLAYDVTAIGISTGAASYYGENDICMVALADFDTIKPYQGNTYHISWQSEAGTVYGGTLDVTTGLLTVTHGDIASYNGESLPGKWISSMDVYSAGGTPTTGAQIVYELATPQTYQLTPTEVTLLLGDNNVWADTGDSTVAYRADTKLYIQKINAPTDDDMIADAQIASGKYFIIGNNLYLSTTTIPAGDTIIPGTNCTKTDLAAALNALNA